jgi:hypothetical protein
MIHTKWGGGQGILIEVIKILKLGEVYSRHNKFLSFFCHLATSTIGLTWPPAMSIPSIFELTGSSATKKVTLFLS